MNNREWVPCCLGIDNLRETTAHTAVAYPVGHAPMIPALMERNEEATYAEFERLKRELIEPGLARHKGRLVKTTGDGAHAEFASPLAAVKCAVEMQNRLASGGSPLTLRVGLNLGDVIVGQDGDLRRGDQYCCPAGGDRRSTHGYI
jgi:hypothetical protein